MDATGRKARPPRLPAAGRWAGLLVLGLAAIAAFGAPPRGVSADDEAPSDPGPGDWAQDAETSALGEHPGAKGLFGYARTSWADDGQETEGAWLWIARREGAPEFAYRVDAIGGEGGGAVLSLSVVEKETATDEDGEEEVTFEAVHVGQGTAGTVEERESAARALVLAADAAAADWAKAVDAESAAWSASDLEKARILARRLESARDAHPEHLGIRRDLVAAYSRLLPLEGDAPRASTLAVLIPKAVEAWRAGCAGHATADDDRLARRALAALHLRHGPVAEAWQVANEDPEDPELARAIAVVQALGYESFEALEPVEVPDALVPCRIEGRHASGTPAKPGTSFERLAFRIVPSGPSAEGAAPYAVSYVLSARAGEGGATSRWALYGVVGTDRRLLRLYGDAEPDGVLVRDAVRAHVARSLRTTTGGEGPR